MRMLMRHGAPYRASAPCLLALTPPRRTSMTLTGQVEMLAALAHARPATARGVALEIAGAQGHVRFLARSANTAARRQLEMVVSGYYPQGSVVALADPADDPARLQEGDGATAVELRLRRQGALPLRTLIDDETSAQLLRVVGVLRNLPAGMRGLCQLILWPAPRGWGRQTSRWLQQERARRAERTAPTAAAPVGLLVGLALAGLVAVTGYHAYQTHDVRGLAGLAAEVVAALALLVARRTVFAPEPPPDLDLVERKLATPIFTARLRLLVTGGQAEQRRAALDALVAAYGAYEEPRGNGFVARPCAPAPLAALTTAGGPRLWRRPWPLLSAAEVACLWHLPETEVDVPGLTRAGPCTLLPAREALTKGIAIGTATIGGHSEPVHIPPAAYRSNVVVLGATGTGKSTFLQHYVREAVARDDVQLVVVDPDSALVADMVGALPDHQKRRAVVIDFGHPEYAVGLNLLDATTGRRTDQIVDSLVQAWARFYAEAWGPRLEDLLRYACVTLLAANRTRAQAHQLTLLDIKPLLQVTAFRDEVVRQAGDVRVTAYWRDDYLGMPRTERLTAIKPVLTRINRFLLNDAAHAVVGQPESTIALPRLLESGVPLFIDAAAHVVGEETAALLDAVLLNIIHDAVCERRTRDRQVLVVVDEFQHAPALWDEYLPRIRKYGGAYVLAAQGLATIDRVQRDLHQVIIGNAGTAVVFRTPDPNEATYLAGVLDNAVTAEDIQMLGLRQCYLKTSDADGPLPVVSATLPPPPRGSSGTARLIAAACARRYGRPIAAVLAARTRWMTELFYTPQEEQREGRNADHGRAQGQTTTDGRTDLPSQDDSGVQGDAPAEAGSSPTLGLTVTRVSAADAALLRRTRRHKNRAGPPQHSDPRAAGHGDVDPLPVPPATPAQVVQLPLLPASDET